MERKLYGEAGAGELSWESVVMDFIPPARDATLYMHSGGQMVSAMRPIAVTEREKYHIRCG